MSRVLFTRRYPPPAADLIRAAGFELDLVDSDEPISRSELLKRARGVAAIVCVLSERIDAEFLDAAGPQLRVVANFAVGYDHVDLVACRSRGVRVTNTPDVLTDATADITWALILAAARHVVSGDRLVRAGLWTGWSPGQLLGLELADSTLGVIGAGRIGTQVALRSIGFRMRVLYSHPRRAEELETRLGARRTELDELLATADVVTLHIPMRPENRHLLDARRIGRMKPGAILVNAARGPIVDEMALIAALREGRLRAAGFDVYENEPRLSPGLAELPNVVLLPHLGSATDATRQRMSPMAAENVLAVLAGREPPNPVG